MDTTGRPSTMAKRPSRSNSTSSSVATVKKPPSVASRPSRRTSTLKPQSSTPEAFLLSPNSEFFVYDAVSNGRKGSVDGKTSSPNRNINRWSHSTTSSTSAIESDQIAGRLNNSQRRISFGSSQKTDIASLRTLNELGLPVLSQTQPTYKRLNGSDSPRREQPPRIELPLPGDSSVASMLYSKRTRSPNTPSTAATTPKAMNSTADYFGETWGYQGAGRAPSPGRTISSTRSRDRSHPKDTASESTMLNGTERLAEADASRADQQRNRSHRSPAQKTMLSQALARANTAVMLDNVQDVDGAIEAYAEACDLLHQVMARSSDRDDRKKLSAIRGTYSNRIAELHDLDDSFADLMEKALPEDPPLEDSQPFYEKALANGLNHETSVVETLENVRIPPRQESLLPEIFGGDSFIQDTSAVQKPLGIKTSLSVPMDAQYMPPPLSPRPLASAKASDMAVPVAHNNQSLSAEHLRRGSSGSASWLNTFDDTSSSAPSSRHPSIDLPHPNDPHDNRVPESEYDNNWDAAVDAAYDEEDISEPTPKQQDKQIKALQLDLPESGLAGNVHIAQLIADPNETQPVDETLDHEQSEREVYMTREYEDSEAEEEALLDEMTKGFAFGEFSFDKHSKSALPRQSSSSTVSGRTWASSIPSTTATNATTLSTLAETIEVNPDQKQIIHVSEVESLPSPPAPEPPPKDSPQSHAGSVLVPPKVSSRPSSLEHTSIAQGLRDRRLSGQSPRQLTIETFARSRSTSRQPGSVTSSVSEAQGQGQHGPTVSSLNGLKASPLLLPGHEHPQTPSYPIESKSHQSGTPEAPAPSEATARSGENEITYPNSPAQRSKVTAATSLTSLSRRNLSSNSLRTRNLSSTTLDAAESPSTPSSAMFPPPNSRMFVPPMPATMAAHIDFHGSIMGGMYLFDHLSSPSTPSSTQLTNSTSNDLIPQSLEPCPESFLLRPFWLMRCLYNAIAHPRGGYVTSKLFVPRDIWRVKNVKLKIVDDKIFQCDLLSAALQKIGKVDNLDADAVLVELQSFEIVLDQVRVNLQKKLGTEVGVQGSSNVFKSSLAVDDSIEPTNKSSNTSSSSKFASTFRKLRSKSSSTAMNNGYTAGVAKDGPSFTMQSLPMTSSTSSPSRGQHASSPRPPVPSPSQLNNIPPLHASYMLSLARLFDAVQVIDSVARQVLDPGLKCSNQTMVGLELSVRSAAEFFAFYILRFVMADVGLLVDKFIKRGTEWVLA